MLTKNYFTVLTAIEGEKKKITQREIAKRCGLSIGSVNSAVAFLHEKNYISDMRITQNGLSALEPYRVKRAVFIAAGFGSRLVPITFNTPKPLVRVKGRRMIDTLLDAVVAAGIEEIVIVRGYLAEQFDMLKDKYPNIQFITNPYYNVANNISSAYLAKDLLCNAYIFEADLFLSNPNLITKYQYTSNYLGVPVDKTDDWCFKVVNGRITKLGIGGIDCFHMYGISYWDEADGKKLAKAIPEFYHSPGGKERFWDQVPLEFYIKDFDVEVRSCTFDDIVEIDTFDDLKNFDKLYDC